MADTKTSQPDLTEDGFACLRDAVTIARERQIRKVKDLRSILERTWEKETVKEALVFWSSYETAKENRA